MNLLHIFSEIEKIDADAPERLAYYSRRQLFRFGSKLTAAAVPTFLATAANNAFAQSADVATVLNFALTLEYLEDDFYKKAIAAGIIPATDLPIFNQISKHETAHVALLKTALGAGAVAMPTINYPAVVFADYQIFLSAAQAFEDAGVRAYKGQAPSLISNPAVLQTALQIHSVEARHASEVRRLRGLKGWISDTTESPAAVYAGEETTSQANIDLVAASGKSPAAVREAFDEPLTMAQILAIVSPYLS